ncbi:MAG TPA: phosphodiester glycosidase family protein [Solirubrobacteraceae bacterium]|nr:phosphodiester glycosidase family protein [Solirubrobacteraceae bacterium]
MRRCVLLVLLALAGAAPARAADLPLGPASLDERRVTIAVAPGVAWTRIVRAGGPWRVHAVTIDREVISGRVTAVLSGDRTHGVQRTSTMARAHRAPVAVNGGFSNVTGEPVGALALGGELVSEPLNGRSSLLLAPAASQRPRIAALRWAGSVQVGGRARLLDGVDRTRGRIPACGGVGGDSPLEVPNAFVTCRDASELVLLTPRFGARTGTPADGWEAVVVGGVVRSARRGGNTPIPAEGFVLSGSGDAASLLREAARPGTPVTARPWLRAGRERLDPADFEAISSGGPRLVRDGRVSIPWRAEGIARAEMVTRAPRTLAGVTAAGRLLLVVADGRRPGWSAGLTLPESARVMRALGARDALSLDGGGSTTLVVNGRVVNRPSDGRERAISDALLVAP